MKFVDYKDPCWVCQCDIGRDALAIGLSSRAAADSEQLREKEREHDTNQWRANHTADNAGTRNGQIQPHRIQSYCLIRTTQVTQQRLLARRRHAHGMPVRERLT